MKSRDDMHNKNSGHISVVAPMEEKSVIKKGSLFILSGPSGVGKGTLRKAIMDIGNIGYSVSCTTRPPREGEIDGVDYKFLSLREFVGKLNESLFLEHALVHGNMYGTLYSDVETILESGDDIILEIDVQGAFQVKNRMECVSVFVLPPSMEALEDRIRKRNADNDEIIELRLKNARYEISCCEEFDYRIVNDSFDKAVFDLKNIIINHRYLSRRV